MVNKPSNALFESCLHYLFLIWWLYAHSIPNHSSQVELYHIVPAYFHDIPRSHPHLRMTVLHLCRVGGMLAGAHALLQMGLDAVRAVRRPATGGPRLLGRLGGLKVGFRSNWWVGWILKVIFWRKISGIPFLSISLVQKWFSESDVSIFTQRNDLLFWMIFFEVML